MNHINIVGPINKVGFGTHASSMLHAFKQLGTDVSLELIGQKLDTCYEEEIVDSLSRVLNSKSPTIHIFHDEYLQKYIGEYIIAFTIFETDIVNRVAIDKINEYSKMVFTTTPEHKELLLKQGVKKPVHVVHEGVDPDIFNSKFEGKLIETGKFTYMLLGKNEKRKNTDTVMAAFLEEMQYENVALIVHSYCYRYGAQEHYKNWYDTNLSLLGYKAIGESDYFIVLSNSYSEIYLIKPILTRDELKSLYQSADVGINYSSAEGWGLPEMEMMACGVPVIISNVIGHKEYIRNLPVFRELIINPVGYEIANDGIYFHGDRGGWSKMGIDPLMVKLRYVFEHSGEYKGISKKLSNYILENYNWKLIAEQVTQILTRG